MKRRLLALFLVLTMALSCVPVQVLADEAAEPQEIALIETAPAEETETVEETESTEETEPTEETEAAEETEATEETEAAEETEAVVETEASVETEDILLLTEDADEEVEAEAASDSHVLPMEIPDDFVAPFVRPNGSLFTDSDSSLPSSYDSREYGRVTAVKNQDTATQQYGYCWAFSALAVSESSLVSAGKANRSVDLAEWHLAKSVDGDAYDPLGNVNGDSTSRTVEGSNNAFTTFALANWVGAASEDDYPYEKKTPVTGTADVMDDAYHLTNAYWLNAGDMDTIKRYIMNNGAVGLSYYHWDTYYNKANSAYYNNAINGTNHAVTVVGWDDNYSASNFNTAPGSDGAWLVKNSWGKSWGKDGYFWLSYCDKTFEDATRKAFVFEMEPADKYDFNYHYDGSFGTNTCYGSSGAAMASVFRASGSASGKDEEIRAVGMGIASANVDYSIQIYRNPTSASRPDSGTAMLSSPQEGKTHAAGYYTVELDEPVRVENGDTFAVVITLRTQDGSDVNFFVDATYENISNGKSWITFTSHTEPNQTFWGQSSNWVDLLNIGGGVTARVKAYTIVVDSLRGLSFAQRAVELVPGKTFSQQPTPQPAEAQVSGYTWKSSDPQVASVDSSGLVTAVKEGTAIITAETSTASSTVSASYQVTVKHGTLSSGSCGDNLTYTLTSDGVLTITGSGAMKNYSDTTAPWYPYSSRITSVILPEGITSIGDWAFSGCTGLTAVTIPRNAAAVGKSSFHGCEGLEEITFEHQPADTLTIGQNAFRLTDALATRVRVPSKKNIHTAVSGYDWAGSNRTVAYVSIVPVRSTITYDANGGSGAPEPTVKVEGEDAFLSNAIPVRTDYRFLGWAASRDAAEAEYQPGDPYTLDEDLTLYAVWRYDPSGIAIENAPETLTSGQSVTLKASAYPQEFASAPITFRLKTSSDSAYLSISRNTLTAKTVTKQVDVTVVASAKDNVVPSQEFTVSIVPKATKVDIYQGDSLVTGKTVPVDINSISGLNLRAQAAPAIAQQKVSWKSSNPSIAEVGDDGTVTFHKTGKVTITATAADGSRKYAKVTLNIVKAATSLEITNAPETLQGGKGLTLKTDIARDKTLDQNVTWLIDPDVAAFASIKAGKLTTKAVYEPVPIHVTAYATANELAVDDVYITLLPTATAASILYQDEITEKTTVLPLKIGQTLTLEGGSYPEDAYGTGAWKSSSTKISAVENGMVTGIKAGTATITYTFAGKSTSVKVQVGNPVTKLSISAPSSALRSGKSMTLTAACNSDASVKKVTWALANPADSAYCSISGSGKLTAKTVYSVHDVALKAVAADGTGVTAESTISILPKTDTVMAIMDAASNDITGKTILLEPGEEMEVGAWAGENPEAVTWKSSNRNAAGIDQNGTITAKKAGTAKITATTSDRRSASFTVKVGVKVNQITIGVKGNAEPVVASGKTLSLTAATNANASNKKVTWALNQPADGKYASVSSSGVVKAAANLTGCRQIEVIATAADGSGVQSDPFPVDIYPVAAGVHILKAGRVVNGLTVVTPDKENTLSAEALPNTARQKVTWKTSSTRIATVDSNGKVTFLKTGTVTITATAADGSKKTASVKLTYKPA